MQAEVRKLEINSDALCALLPQQRYVFALTSHIFNELMLLQKWIHVSRRPPGNPGPQEDVAVAMSMFILRLLSSKVHEALEVLTKKSVDDVLRPDYLRKVNGLEAHWDAAVTEFEALEWLRWIRNRGGFHYMNEGQWTPALTDEMCEGAYAYMGKRYSDTYFHWAEMTASLPAMQHVNNDAPLQGLEQMLNELGSLLGKVTECLARGLQAFLKESGVGGALSEPVRFDAPEFKAPKLDYFFADERLKG